jgi:hypothetical protein
MYNIRELYFLPVIICLTHEKDGDPKVSWTLDSYRGYDQEEIILESMQVKLITSVAAEKETERWRD